MEFSTSQQIQVGIFVVVGVLVMAISIIMLGDDQVSFSGTYELRVQLKQVQGLNKGSMASLAGMRVGNVERIEFAPDAQELVAVLSIDRSFQKRITEGSTAAIKTLGALGDRYVYIAPGPLDAAPLSDGAMIPSDSGEDLFDVLSKRGPELTNIVEVINEMNVLLRNINQDNRSRQLMDNLIGASAQLKALATDARESMDKEKLKDAINRMSNIMTKIDRGEGTLGALINDPTLHQKISNLFGDSSRRQFLKPLIRESIREDERIRPVTK